MSLRFIRIAAVYAMLGVAMGIYMAATHQFEAKVAHAHALLVGWLSLLATGVVYRVFPEMAESALAKVHFWLHNLGLPVMIAGILMIYYTHAEKGEPLAGIGSTVVALGFVAFAINAWLPRRG